jgi:hypothetical protein
MKDKFRDPSANEDAYFHSHFVGEYDTPSSKIPAASELQL